MNISGLELGLGFIGNLIAVWGIVDRSRREQHAREEKRFDEINRRFDSVERASANRFDNVERAAGLVQRHEQRFADAARDVSELKQRLDRLEGGLSAQIHSVESGMFSIGKEVAELRGELKLATLVRGLVGKRETDRDPIAGG